MQSRTRKQQIKQTIKNQEATKMRKADDDDDDEKQKLKWTKISEGMRGEEASRSNK